jgi:hypothetical protein
MAVWANVLAVVLVVTACVLAVALLALAVTGVVSFDSSCVPVVGKLVLVRCA